MLTKKLYWWKSDSDDWLSLKVDKWFTRCRGYRKLPSKKLSRSCQTMLDYSQQKPLTWSHSDTQLVQDLSQENSKQYINNEEDKKENKGKEEHLQCPAVRPVVSLQSLFDNKEIEEYLEYLNKPVITMNDHYIEIHQYHYEPEMIQKMLPELRAEYRPQSSRRHYIDEARTEIIETKGFCPVSTEYSEFLIKRNQEYNRPIQVVSDESANLNKSKDHIKDGNNTDKHRSLSQVFRGKLEPHNIKDINSKMNEGQIFTKKSESSENSSYRSFSRSLRSSRKNKSGRRKKRIIVGESGLNGPIWPGVLLTFDRAVSPTPDAKENEPDESFI